MGWDGIINKHTLNVKNKKKKDDSLPLIFSHYYSFQVSTIITRRCDDLKQSGYILHCAQRTRAPFVISSNRCSSNNTEPKQAKVECRHRMPAARLPPNQTPANRNYYKELPLLRYSAMVPVCGVSYGVLYSLVPRLVTPSKSSRVVRVSSS